MSLNSLANHELVREAQSRIPQSRGKVAGGAESAQPGPAGRGDMAGGGDVDQARAANRLSDLVKYIPTESITLYVATVSALPALADVIPALTSKWLYWGYGVVVTPLLLLLILAAKRKAVHLPPLPSLREAPWWKLIAATLAFLAWALAVPSNPYATGQTGGLLGAFAAVFVSTILSLFQPLFETDTEVDSPPA